MPATGQSGDDGAAPKLLVGRFQHETFACQDGANLPPLAQTHTMAPNLGRALNTRRKPFLALGAGALTASFGSFAQPQGKVWRVGVLVQERRPPSLDSHRFGEFPRGMHELGYIEGKNLVIEWRFADGVSVRLPALIVAPDALFAQEARQIAQLAAKHRLPSIDGLREAVEAGTLMSYGQNRAENVRLAATYVDKIFRGATPGDIPVEQASKFELFINNKTAKSLGIKIPDSILVRADKVIE